MSIRDMSRNVCILTEDAYLDSEDKKTHDYKGVIESSRRAEEIKDFLAAKSSKIKKMNWKKFYNLPELRMVTQVISPYKN